MKTPTVMSADPRTLIEQARKERYATLHNALSNASPTVVRMNEGLARQLADVLEAALVRIDTLETALREVQDFGDRAAVQIARAALVSSATEDKVE